MSSNPLQALADLAASQVERQQTARTENRKSFPFAASLKDQLEAAGITSKVLYAREGEKEVGKPQPFDGIDVDQLIRYYDRRTNVIREKRK